MQKYVLEVDEDRWFEDMMLPLQEQAEFSAEEDFPRIELSPGIREALIGLLRQDHLELSKHRKSTNPKPAMSQKPSAPESEERLYGVQNLLEAFPVCQKTKNPIVIFWS